LAGWKQRSNSLGKSSLSTRKNEIWFDLVAREYGKLRFDLDVLKEEVSLSGINAG
jgi:hypothetical protein